MICGQTPRGRSWPMPSIIISRAWATTCPAGSGRGSSTRSPSTREPLSARASAAACHALGACDPHPRALHGHNFLARHRRVPGLGSRRRSPRLGPLCQLFLQRDPVVRVVNPSPSTGNARASAPCRRAAPGGAVGRIGVTAGGALLIGLDELGRGSAWGGRAAGSRQTRATSSTVALPPLIEVRRSAAEKRPMPLQKVRTVSSSPKRGKESTRIRVRRTIQRRVPRSRHHQVGVGDVLQPARMASSLQRPPSAWRSPAASPAHRRGPRTTQRFR